MSRSAPVKKGLAKDIERPYPPVPASLQEGEPIVRSLVALASLAHAADIGTELVHRIEFDAEVAAAIGDLAWCERAPPNTPVTVRIARNKKQLEVVTLLLPEAAGRVQQVHQAIDHCCYVLAPLNDPTPDTRLHEITKVHVDETRCFKSPPEIVLTVMDATLAFLKRQPSWDNARVLLREPTMFLHLIQRYQLPDQVVLDELRSYIRSPKFRPEIAGRASRLCQHLCSFLIATCAVWSKLLEVAVDDGGIIVS